MPSCCQYEAVAETGYADRNLTISIAQNIRVPSRCAFASSQGYGPNVMSKGCIPTSGIIARTVSEAMSITVTVVDLVSDTYNFV
jgi:hypothetical protein